MHLTLMWYMVHLIFVTVFLYHGIHIVLCKQFTENFSRSYDFRHVSSIDRFSYYVAVCYKLVFEFSGFDPFECLLETVSRQLSVWRIWIDVSTALLQTNVADYVTLSVHMNGVPQTILSAYSGHLHVATVGNGIFPAKFLDEKCYAVMADRKKCLPCRESESQYRQCPQ